MVISKWLLVIGSETPAVICLLSSVLCLQPSTSVENPLQISSFYAKQSQFAGCPNERKFYFNKVL